MPKIVKFGLALLAFHLLGASSAWAKTELYFTPAETKVNPNQPFELELKVSSGESILGADLQLSFDPQSLNLEKAQVGDFWSDPQTLLNQTDNKKGQLQVSLFQFPGRDGTGTVAKLTFRLIKDSPETVIKIDPETVIAGTNGQKITSSLGRALILTGQNPPASPQPTNPPTTAPASTSGEPVPADNNGSLTSTEEGPTIYLADQVTPTPTATNNPGKALQIVGLFLLLFGAMAVFAFRLVGPHA